MTFEKFFTFMSYLAVFCGFLALWVSGTFGLVGTVMFVSIAIAAWFLEGSRWQVSEKLGTALIILALPVYFLVWKFQLLSLPGREAAIAGLLARLILSLTAVKLLQRKSDRDWIFLYLMAFFEVLLAAGLSVSASYLVSLLAFLLVMVCTIIAFEIRKTSRAVDERIAMPAAKSRETKRRTPIDVPFRRLPTAAIVLIFSIVAVGLPLFFFLPRVGGAGFGGLQGSVSTYSGFSDTVRLGGIGRIQQSDDVVMRVRVEGADGEQPDLYWRGVALDTFDNQSWSKANPGAKEQYVKGEREFIQVDFATGRDNLSVQTVYLEPLDASVLFGLPRIVALQTNLPAVYKDMDGSLTFSHTAERISYRVLSDRAVPSIDKLRADTQTYSAALSDDLALPEDFDSRISDLAASVTAGKKNRYDKARAVESYLQTEFSYTLEQKAGGAQPLSDFLFNVKQGHCEYFATAMAIMLRTQGIATRVVNGFHQGDYNDTAGVYVVRQKNAHSWVEVYFPHEGAWVKFDPTPPAGQVAPADNVGITGSIQKYLDAFETFWIQYFVAYDNQEQRSLMRSVRTGFFDYQAKTTTFLSKTQDLFGEWWADVKGDRGAGARLSAIGNAGLYVVLTSIGVLFLVWLSRRIVKLKVWRAIVDWLRGRHVVSIVEFYDRMLQILADKGFSREPHQTPLEFAYGVGMPDVIDVTEKYNRVRFGEKELTESESEEIQRFLMHLRDS
jgi:transglutaminase-like putative cysteine protease